MEQRSRVCRPTDVSRALAALGDGAPRTEAKDWPGNLRGLDSAGLYSWGVDPAGARDLTTGLGRNVDAGLIYAGQTGATKWPSGKRGSGALRSRIGSQHVRGRIRGSTFRLTVGAALAQTLGLETTGPKKLA